MRLRGGPARAMAGLLVVFVAAACTAGVSPTPGTPTSSATTAAAATSIPTVSPTPTPLPSATPRGVVTGIHWTKSKSQPYAAASRSKPTEPPEGSTDFGWQVFGWSKGYVAFHQLYNGDDASLAMDTSQSTDGVTWTAGERLDLTGSASGESAGTMGFEGITGVVEGPAGLLAYSIGRPDCGSILVDGGVWPVAISSDGIIWQPINVDASGKAANESLVGHSVGGGPAGYITAGKNGIFTSTDGLTWNTADIKSDAFKGFSAIESGTAITGGFVVAGASKFPVAGCVGPGSPALLVPSVWWSADGSSWTSETLPDAGRAEDINTTVCRMGNQLLVATDGDQSWASADGRTWKSVSAELGSLCIPIGLTSSTVVLTGDECTLVLSGSATISVLRADLSLVKLTQTGDLPADGTAQAVLGPAGLVVTDEHGNVYVGVLLTV